MKRKHRSSSCALLALSLPTAVCAAPVANDPVPHEPVAGAAPVAGCAEATIGPVYDAVV